MPKLHPHTAFFLANVERLIPKTPKKTGYVYDRFILDEKVKNLKPAGYPFYYKIKKYFTTEEIKTGRFLDMIRLQESPQEYCFLVNWKPSSPRFGCRNDKSKILFSFTIQNLDNGIYLKIELNKKVFPNGVNWYK